MKFTLKFLLILPTAFLLFGCAENNGMDTYSENRIGSVHKVERGKVLSVRQVKLADDKIPQASLEKTMESYRQKKSAEQGNPIRFTKYVGLEYIVETVKGNVLSFVESGEAEFKRGDRVLIIFGPRSHLVPDPSSSA